MDTKATERQWQVADGQKHLGVFPESRLAALAAAGRVPPHVLLSCGSGWLTLQQFMAQCRARPQSANGVSRPMAPPTGQQTALPSGFPSGGLAGNEPPDRAAFAPGVADEAGRMFPPPLAVDPFDEPPAFHGPPARDFPPPPPLPSPRPAAHARPNAPVRPPPPGIDAPSVSDVPPFSPLGADPPIEVEVPQWVNPAAGPVGQPAPAPPLAPEPFAPPVAPAAGIEDDGPPERDRIVMLGRRQSGKTIYLAALYVKLWRALDGLTAKALRGEVHKQLMDVNQVLREGRWPAATLENRHMELELEEEGKKRLMVALDYAGELFANAFVHERLDVPEVKSLVNHIDRAAAVMLLVDPSIVAGMDHQAALEDDFGLVQAVNRIRNWPGGDDVPIVLVLTKVDQHQSLLDRFGGPDGFIRHHFPALVRLLKRVAIFQVSAVQVERGPGGKPVPRKDSTPMNVDNPLRYCIRKIHKAEAKVELERSARESSAMESRLRLQEQRREHKQNLLISVAIISVVVVGFVIIALVVLKG